MENRESEFIKKALRTLPKKRKKFKNKTLLNDIIQETIRVSNGF